MILNGSASLLLRYLLFVKMVVYCQDFGEAENQAGGMAVMAKYNGLELEDEDTVKHGLTNDNVGFNSNGKYQLIFNNFTYYTDELQNRKPTLEVKVKSTSNSIKTLQAVLKWNSAVHFKRTFGAVPESRKVKEKIPEEKPTDMVWKSFARISNLVKKDQPSNITDAHGLIPYLAAQSNYYIIPKKTVELLQSNNMCPRQENEIQPCSTVFMKSQRIGRVWPRDLLTASCRCDGQRCNLMGLDTCTTLISRVMVIGHKGTRSRDIVPVACVCMAFRGIPAKEMVPALV